MPTDLRSRKRLATRQGISNAATRLFLERGFDPVTVDEIAAAADVGRMTVFNHFPRKEDMFFDRDEAARELLRQTLVERDPAVPPVEALRRLAHELVAERSPYVRFSADSQGFIGTIAASETLKARARAIRDEIAQLIGEVMAASVGKPEDDPDAHLAAGLLVAGWAVALTQAHVVFKQSGDARAAEARFLALVEQGTAGVKVAVVGTGYV